MTETEITAEDLARTTALAQLGAAAANELIANVEKDAGVADTIGVLSGIVDAVACYLAVAASPEIAAQILNDVGASLEERLREATKPAH